MAPAIRNNHRLSDLCRYAFESLVGQIIVDEKGIILYFSKEHTKFTGITKEEAEGHFVEDVLPGTKMYDVVKTGKPQIGSVFEMKHRETNQSKFMVCNRIPIRDDNDKIIGAMAETVFSRGIDDLHRLTKEVKQYNDDDLFTHEDDYFINLNNRKPVKNNKTGEVELQASNIRGVSSQIMELKHLISRIANMPLPVLITGETGAGKEVFAEALHLMSNRRHGNFVRINCAAIPRELLESELFGYEKGAFSGANSTGKMGKFEYAGNGTILLDEIGDMPLELQVKLLRVLQEKEFERVGGLKSIPFNARVICTTNKDIQKLIDEGKFREDLYYRINVLELYIPPLRERKEDIPELSEVFIRKMNSEFNLSITGINEDVLEKFNQYDWPGNVRELQHVIERATMMRGEGILTEEDFTFFNSRIKDFMTSDASVKSEESDDIADNDTFDIRAVKMKAEKNIIIKALKACNGCKKDAANLLGIQRTVLYEKIKRYGIIDE